MPTVDPTATIGAFAVIGSGATIGARTIVHPHVVIGDGTTIGPDCILHAHVSIRERCTIGARVIVQNGAVIGSDGYGFAQRADGSHEKIPQTAPVVIEDDVEIGANTTIDRPAVGETRIKAGTKIDNLVQIGHGVVLGKNVLLAAQVGIAGSTVLGDSVQFGGQVGVGGHLTIGDRVKAVGQSGITNSVDADEFVSGYPAIPNSEWKRSSVVFRKLPEMRKQLRALEERLKALEEQRIEESKIKDRNEDDFRSCSVVVAARGARSGTCRCRRRFGRRSSNINGWSCRTAWSSSCTRTSRRRSSTSSSGITSARRTKSRAAPASRISSST